MRKEKEREGERESWAAFGLNRTHVLIFFVIMIIIIINNIVIIVMLLLALRGEARVVFWGGRAQSVEPMWGDQSFAPCKEADSGPLCSP